MIEVSKELFDKCLKVHETHLSELDELTKQNEDNDVCWLDSEGDAIYAIMNGKYLVASFVIISYQLIGLALTNDNE